MTVDIDYMTTIQNIVEDIKRTQRDAMKQAADLAVQAIGSERWCYLFGTGHSHMPCLEAYPRIGGIVGFRPMIELGLSTPNYMIGDNGLLQGTFLEQVEGYGDVILQSHPIAPPDCIIIFSNSGVNAVPIDVALGCRRRSVKVIAVTSVQHSETTGSRHSSGKKLLDVADVVIDNCLPPGDAQIYVDGLDQPVGACSTIASMVIIQSIVCLVAEGLVQQGQPPLVLHSHNRRDGQEAAAHNSMEQSVQEYGRRLGRSLLEFDTTPR